MSDHGGLPATLAALATALSTPHTEDTVSALAQALTELVPGLRLLALAVAYHDLHADTDRLSPVRRTDAVDVDGRVYQITHRSHGDPLLSIDDGPDPTDTPATHLGLAALVATATRARTG